MNIHILLFSCKFKAEITVDSFNMLDIEIVNVSPVEHLNAEDSSVHSVSLVSPCRGPMGQVSNALQLSPGPALVLLKAVTLQLLRVRPHVPGPGPHCSPEPRSLHK